MTDEVKLAYPEVRRDESIEDEYHGIKVKDAYRWLEDGEMPETLWFIDGQNKLSRPFLEQCDKWKLIRDKLRNALSYPSFSCPMKCGKYYYMYMNTGLQNQSVFYQMDTLDSEAKVYFHSNDLARNEKLVVGHKSFTDDGTLIAYGLSTKGSNFIKIHTQNVETREDSDEILEKAECTDISWTKDNKGFFYLRYLDASAKSSSNVLLSRDQQAEDDEEKEGKQKEELQTIPPTELLPPFCSVGEHLKVYYHHVGESQENDVLVAEFLEEPKWRMKTLVSDCGNYLIMKVRKENSAHNQLYFADLKKAGDIREKLVVYKIVDQFEATFDYITNEDNHIYVRTNKNAPNYRVVVIDLENPSEDNWFTLIAEHDRDYLDYAKCAHEDKLVLCYQQDVKSVLQVNSLLTGNLIRKFDLDIGTVMALSARRCHSEMFFNFTSFLCPGIIYHYDFGQPDEKPRVYRDVKLNIPNFHREDFKVEQVFYNSRDDTRISMFLVHKIRETAIPRPCLLYGFGGLGVSLQPAFGITGAIFADTFDGMLAYPNVRGGGEYGETWHEAGRKLNKQNSLDDFQAAAKYLLDHNYTTKENLIIQGGSNGGFLVAASIIQSPQLFGVAVAQVGLMDLIRFPEIIKESEWTSEYGDPREEEHFKNLYRLSPLHNVRTPSSPEDEFPATLLLTAECDRRISPMHSMKFAAALQHAARNSEHQHNPILIRVYSMLGCGNGNTTSKRIDEVTDILTFMYRNLKLDEVKL